MALFLDARVPLIFGQAGDAYAMDAVLLEGTGAAQPGRAFFQPEPAPLHPGGCICCTPRNGAAMALARLILARGRGDGVFFKRVIAVTETQAGRADVLAALENDPIVSCVCRPG